MMEKRNCDASEEDQQPELGSFVVLRKFGMNVLQHSIQTFWGQVWGSRALFQ